MVRLLFSILFLLLLLFKCGVEDQPYEIKDKVKTPLEATPQNYEVWSKYWNHQQWIFAWDEQIQPHTQSPETLKQFFTNQFASLYSIPENRIQNFTNWFNQNLELEWLPNPPLAVEKNNVTGFTAVGFRSFENQWKDFLSVFALLNGGLSDKLLVHHFWSKAQKMNGVLWIEPSLTSEIYQDPNTTYRPPVEIESPSIGPILKLIKADKAYEYAFQNKMVNNIINVAVLDTGVDYLHSELSGQMYENKAEKNGQTGVDDDGNGYVDDIYGTDLNYGTLDKSDCKVPSPGAADVGGAGNPCGMTKIDDISIQQRVQQCGHGTHVAGLIAGKKGGDPTAMGICPNCRILSLRVAGRKCVNTADGEFQYNVGILDLAQIRAMQYILNLTDATGHLKIHMINMSFGKVIANRSLRFLTKTLQDQGVLIVSAAGNEDTETPSYPAAFGNVLAVCALSNANNRGVYAKTSFSNFGEWVDICAPGRDIYSLIPGGFVDINTGTSQASPIVAGAAGYLWGLYPQMLASEVADQIRKYANATNVYDEPKNILYSGYYKDGSKYYMLGSGLLNLEASIKKVSGQENEVSQGKIGQQIKRGCVASHVGEGESISFWDASSSMPFLLGQFTLLWLLNRKKIRKA